MYVYRIVRCWILRLTLMISYFLPIYQLYHSIFLFLKCHTDHFPLHRILTCLPKKVVNKICQSGGANPWSLALQLNTLLDWPPYIYVQKLTCVTSDARPFLGWVLDLFEHETQMQNYKYWHVMFIIKSRRQII